MNQIVWWGCLVMIVVNAKTNQHNGGNLGWIIFWSALMICSEIRALKEKQ